MFLIHLQSKHELIRVRREVRRIIRVYIGDYDIRRLNRNNKEPQQYLIKAGLYCNISVHSEFSTRRPPRRQRSFQRTREYTYFTSFDFCSTVVVAVAVDRSISRTSLYCAGPCVRDVRLAPPPPPGRALKQTSADTCSPIPTAVVANTSAVIYASDDDPHSAVEGRRISSGYIINFYSTRGSEIVIENDDDCNRARSSRRRHRRKRSSCPRGRWSRLPRRLFGKINTTT